MLISQIYKAYLFLSSYFHLMADKFTFLSYSLIPQHFDLTLFIST